MDKQRASSFRLSRGRSYLLVPAAGAGEGMGHLARCLRLARRLGPRVTFLTSRMDSAARGLLSGELSKLPGHPRPAMVARPSPESHWDLIVVDQRSTSKGELLHLMPYGLVVCLDEGGEAGGLAPFLLDSIPGLPGMRPANLASPEFLELPRRRRDKAPTSFRRVLVTFGGEDHRGSSDKTLAVLLGSGLFEEDALTVVEGPLFTERHWPPKVRVLKSPSALTRHIPAFDLVITHFGITAFEALASGVPVILLNPSRLHARLGHAAGFSTIGTLRPRADVLRSLLADPRPLIRQVADFNKTIGPGRTARLPAVLRTLARQGSSTCPVCGLIGNHAIARFPDRTYRRCRRCGVIYLESFSTRRVTYGREYFSSEYRAHYGKTYLEDFESIKSACRPRVAAVKSFLGNDVQGAVVDVGCAYGPFLDAAREAGLHGYGIDVSSAAVAYVRDRLKVPALKAAFEDAGRTELPRRIAAVTLWYVLEHFTATDLILRKAASLLPARGVLAFSTPNGRGISARKGLASFLHDSPADHFTVFAPRGLRKLLVTYGFELRRVKVTGHHPERFPGVLGRLSARSRVVHSIMLRVSMILGLGDTFEAYAVKGE